MIRLLWRRQRAALLLLAAMTIATIAVLLLGRITFLDAVADSGAPPNCLADRECLLTQLHDIANGYRWFWGLGHTFLIVSPLLMGLLAGSGLFGRDIEEGTYVYALTQEVSHRRWWLTNLAVCGGLTIAAAAVVSAVSWWVWQPFLNFAPASPLGTPMFQVSGVVPVAYAVLAFTLAAVGGLVARSALAGVVVATVGYGVVLFCLAVLIRFHYLPPDTLTTPYTGAGFAGAPDGALGLGDTFLDAAGNEIPSSVATSQCAPSVSLADCARSAGAVSIRFSYQPAERYWPFQFIEAAITLVIAAAAVVVGRVRLQRLVSRS